MSVTQNDVRNAYRFVLGREPESEEVIQFWAGRVNSWKELRQCFQDSEEYKLNNPARIAQASASHEDFYLKKCDGDFFWCLRSDGDDNVSQAIRATGRWGEATELKEVIKQLDKNKKSGGGTAGSRRECRSHQHPICAGWMACNCSRSWVKKC